MDRVTIQWTETARSGLAKLPRKVRRGLLDKANELKGSDDPRDSHKPLKGSLSGYYRICYSRYRAVYTVSEKPGPGGGSRLRIFILFVAVGIRKEGDKKDIYRLAKKLVDLGLIEPDPEGESS